MRILHVLPGLTYERGGPTEVLRALVRCQAALGHQVRVLTTDQGSRHGERPAELPDAIAVERVLLRGPDRAAYAPHFARAVRSRVRTHDVVHIHSVFTYPVHRAASECAASGTPMVLRPCGHLHRYSLLRSRWRKAAYLALCGGMIRRACTAWHFTSPNESQESWPWDESPRFVLPNGIEPSEYAVDRDDARQAVGRQWQDLDGVPFVLFLGRLDPKKRLDLLIDAFLRGAPARFKLVVAGPDRCGLWNKLAGRFLRDPRAARRVLRLDTVVGPEKIRLLAAAALFVLPSEHENFGLAALESLAAGTPVLLSPHVDLAGSVSIAEMVHTSPLRVTAWSDRLAALLGERRDTSAAQDAARRWVGQHYSWDRIAATLIERYRWAIEGCPPQGVPQKALPSAA